MYAILDIEIRFQTSEEIVDPTGNDCHRIF